MFRSKKIAKYIAPGNRVHLVGIGGVSMRPLGLVLKGMGMKVTGSDMSASAGTEELISEPVTSIPMPLSTKPRGRMETPPMPTRCTRLPGTRNFVILRFLII